MEAMELWRLTDHYNVEDAAILVAGGEPNYHRNNEINAYAGFVAAIQTVETALKRAILKNALRADLVFYANGFWETDLNSETMEPVQSWRAIVAMTRDDHFPLQTGKGLADLSGLQGLQIYPEPDWDRTLINREDLKGWLQKRGVFPEFFFENEQIQSGPKSKSHPRYSSKLACAVSAWEAVEEADLNKSVKQTIEAWVRKHANKFDLVDNDGRPIENAVAEISKVVNWKTKGGATPTQLASSNLEVDEPDTKVNNFDYVNFGSDYEDDSEIPF